MSMLKVGGVHVEILRLEGVMSSFGASCSPFIRATLVGGGSDEGGVTAEGPSDCPNISAETTMADKFSEDGDAEWEKASSTHRLIFLGMNSAGVSESGDGPDPTLLLQVVCKVGLWDTEHVVGSVEMQIPVVGERDAKVGSWEIDRPWYRPLN
jgi:hypothetical protein